MPTQTNEQALEALIERALTGISREQLQAEAGNTVTLQTSHPYHTETGYGYCSDAQPTPPTDYSPLP